MSSDLQSAKDDQAKRLAQRHYEIEEGITQIFQIRQRVDLEVTRSEPVTLLEVNANTIPSGIMPIQFGPNLSSGFKYPTVIVEVTPEEYEQITVGDLPLPTGWEIGAEIPRLGAMANE